MSVIDYGDPGLSVARRPAADRRKMAFFVVAAVLVLAAGALNYLVPSMKLHFRKEAVQPAEPLKMIAADLGAWAQISVDRALNPDFEHELGATQYVFRNYIDTRQLKDADRKKLLSMPGMEEREKFASTLHNVEASSLIRFALTYYTGSVDTVPHVPDRCYAADGYKPSTYEVVTWPVLPRTDAADQKLNVRLIQFEDQIDARQSRPRQVSYFFQVNHHYEDDPIFGVRKRLQNIWESKAYFAKIELVTDLPDANAAQKTMADFLTSAMPDIERVLPQPAKQ